MTKPALNVHIMLKSEVLGDGLHSNVWEHAVCTHMFENDGQPMRQGSQASVDMRGICLFSFPKLGSKTLWWPNPAGA